MAAENATLAPAVHTIRDEGDFRDLLKDILLKADYCERIDGLLGLLEMNGLTSKMIPRAISMLRCEVSGALSPPQEQRTLRACLRLMAVHAATPLCDRSVADISFCLEEAICGRLYTSVDLAEIVDDEHALPFIFSALKTFRHPDYRRDVLSLASCLFMFMRAPLRVTVAVRHYPLLAGFLMSFLGEIGEEDVDSYHALSMREFSGIVATTPALIGRLLAAVKMSPDVNDVAYSESCECLLELLTNLLDTSPALLEYVLGYGVLTAMMQFYASPSHNDHYNHAVGPINAILAANPQWKQAVKRIADSSTVNNAVVRLGKALPPRTSVAVVYDMCEI